MAYQNQTGDRLKEITDKLEKGLQDLFSSGQYADYLKTMSKFYGYSASNTLLIYMQRPDASRVAGYNDWKDNFKRHVKRGEHGIKILAPCPYKQQVEREQTGPDGRAVTVTEEVTRAAFKPVTVFDVSQTEGEPLPSLGVNELTGDVEHYPDFFEALKQVAPFPVGFEAIASGAKGYCNYAEQRIAINEGMAEVQNVKTAIHEITHATLHNYYAEKEKEVPPEQRKDQRTREVEAESVAYTVCQHYGIETSDYSFGYIAGWSSDKQTKELKASLATIRETAAGLIDSIDGAYQEIVKAKEQVQQRAAEKENPLAAAEMSVEQNYNMIDGIINNLPPDASMTDRANALIDHAERDGQRLGNGERRLIVEYAEQVRDVQKLAALVNELAEQGFEQKNHYVNPADAERVDAEITAAKVQRMIGGLLDPTIQPIVTILWSESAGVQDGQQMTLAEADALFQRLDAAHTEPGYDKTSFRIDFTFQGELDSYEGRQDFGDGDGGLIDHIKSYHEYYAKDEHWKNHVLHHDGPEALEQDTAHREMLLNEFIPYLRLHCNLSEMERAATDALAVTAKIEEPDGLDRTNAAYYGAVQAYVTECRGQLNTGAYQLPEAPKKEDFIDPELRAYQEQVREEVKQEAAAAGMTVEEYAANGYEPFSSSQPVQEQAEAPAKDAVEPPAPTEAAPEQLSFSQLVQEQTKAPTAEEPAPAENHPDVSGAPTAGDAKTTAPTYYAINETSARRAKEAISFSDYRPGSATSEYRQMVDEAVKIAERQKKRVDPMHHEKIDRLLDTYCRKLAANMNHHNEIMARVPSVMIAGPSNFPVRKKEKQNAAMDSNMQEWRDIQGLLDKIRSTGMGGISADDPDAVSKLQAKLANLQESQETMKAVNAYYRKHKTLDGCPDLPPQTLEKLKADMAQGWHLEDKPFASWALSNNNAEIHRVKARIESLTRKEQTPFAGWEFDGGKVEINREENRLQVFFEGKPDADTRAELKDGGFRWAPSAGAWQRQLTDNAFRAADTIKAIAPVTGEKPTELQRKARREKPSIREQLDAAKSVPEQPHKKKAPSKDGPERS
ncbi:DUF4316 domain-containing protein [Lachnoclostridium pacaense]|uniref:LPD25 domain-containing protein n=1 Tax=Enterocloster hominis (ex Hitch et al. 2024) TaxID=1917870 RepID=UPI001D118F1C|nr:LPD25 domain-containing protein [Lachnoclostridium pacaense]MCC2818960.1 DUF4316 domain-containing protein [Lachnoclostridium pacaense]